MQNEIQKLTAILKNIMYEKLLKFVDQNYEEEESDLYAADEFVSLDEEEEIKQNFSSNRPKPIAAVGAAISGIFFDKIFSDIDRFDYRKIRNMRTPTFSETLLKMIDERGLKDSEVYGRVGIDRRLFSKIRIHPEYRPAKSTVLMFAIALELDVEQTKKLLETAGYSLSRSIMQDLIVEFFITNKVYDIMTINEALYDCGEKTLGV